MQKDLISGFDIKDIDKNLAKTNSRMSLALLIFSIVYFSVEVHNWYVILSNTNESKVVPSHFIYLYRLSPLISFTEMIIDIIACSYYYNAWKNQSRAIDEGDTMLFNKNLRYFNTALKLSIIFFLLSFLRMWLRSVYYV